MTGVAEPISAFVLAGGKSSRMGRDKSLLTFCGRYLIEYAIEVLRHHTDDIRIIGDPDKYQFLKLPVLADRIASNGPLSGIYTGLDVARTEFSLFIACDMPLMRPEFLGLLLDHAARADAVAFKSADGKVEPLAAVYARSGFPTLKKNISLGQFKITKFLDQIRVCYLEETDLSRIGLSHNIFTNVNSPEDLQFLESLH